MHEPYTIGKALDEYYVNGIQGKLISDFTYYPYEDTHQVTVSFDNEAVVSCLENYRKFKRDFIIPYNSMDSLDVLKYELTKYMLFNTDRIKRIAYALNIAYSPIENVDENTTNTTTHSGVDQTSSTMGARKSSSYNDNTAIPTAQGYVSTFDSTEPVLMSKSTDTGKTINDIDSATDSSSLTHGHKEELKVRRRGNIGVTANFQLIEGELLHARCWNLLDLIIADFIASKYYYHSNYEEI